MNVLKIAREKIYLFPLFLIIISYPKVSAADGDEGFLYGKITMDNGNTYQGAIRWGDEEAFWDDMFNSTKDENVFEQYLSDRDVESLEDEIYSRRDRRRNRRNRPLGFLRIFLGDDWEGVDTHQFKCRFGDVKKMELRGRESVVLTFKNGEEMRIEGGSNDIGASIRIFDEEVDEVKLKWRRIDTIEFIPTPERLKKKFGSPLFGEVETRRGRFEGFIQWDHDECLSTDVLDGDSEDGDMEIQFDNIRSIEKYRRGSLVTLKSGREFYLTGSNDVNSENRGVIVKDPRFGKVLIGWREFENITFRDRVNDSGPAFDDFIVPKMLSGVVKTEDGKTHSGRIIYDLDEAYDLEILDGKDGKIEYLIPFRKISKIIPYRRYGSTVTLKSGEELELEDSRDIDEDNDGIIVWDSDKEEYIPWREVEEIVFN